MTYLSMTEVSSCHIKLNVMIIYVIDFIKLNLDNRIRNNGLRCLLYDYLHIRHQHISNVCVLARCS